MKAWSESVYRQEPSVNMWAWGSNWPLKSRQLSRLDLTGRQDTQLPGLLVRAGAPAHKLLLSARTAWRSGSHPHTPFCYRRLLWLSLAPSQQPPRESFFWGGGIKSLQNDWLLHWGMEERGLPTQPHWVVPEPHQSLSITDCQGRDTSYIQNDGQRATALYCLTFSEKHYTWQN